MAANLARNLCASDRGIYASLTKTSLVSFGDFYDLVKCRDFHAFLGFFNDLVLLFCSPRITRLSVGALIEAICTQLEDRSRNERYYAR